MEPQQLQRVLEGALMAYGQPLSVEKLQSLFIEDTQESKTQETKDQETKDQNSNTQYIPNKTEILEALEAIQAHYADRGIELKKVSSGWRFQVRADMAGWINRLWEEKPQRYSRALLETLAIIAYRQPITRGDIEEIRGVAVSSHIIKTLSEREWIKVVGQRDVPGRPSLYATTKQFLDYFNLESLEALPSLRELADIDSLTPELDLSPVDEPGEATVASAETDDEADRETGEETVIDSPVTHTETTDDSPTSQS